MPFPKELDHCPTTPECRARKLYQDDEGNIFKFDLETGKFKPHVCNSVGITSELPQTVFAGEWFNKRTHRTRFTGPFRIRSSAIKPPPEKVNGRGAKYDKKDEWRLVKVHTSPCTWEVLKG
jgi:hypothetical protein